MTNTPFASALFKTSLMVLIFEYTLVIILYFGILRGWNNSIASVPQPALLFMQHGNLCFTKNSLSISDIPHPLCLRRCCFQIGSFLILWNFCSKTHLLPFLMHSPAGQGLMSPYSISTASPRVLCTKTKRWLLAALRGKIFWAFWKSELLQRITEGHLNHEKRRWKKPPANSPHCHVWYQP